MCARDCEDGYKDIDALCRLAGICIGREISSLYV